MTTSILAIPARTRRPACLAGTLALGLLGLVAGGCNNAGEGALSGAAIGAGSGAAIGAIAGGGQGAGIGAAIGAIGGALGGAVIGDQNERNASRR